MTLISKIKGIMEQVQPESPLGCARPSAVLCLTCSVLCSLEKSKVDKSRAVSLKHEAQLGATGPIGLRPAMGPTSFLEQHLTFYIPINQMAYNNVYRKSHILHIHVKHIDCYFMSNDQYFIYIHDGN